MQDEIGNELQPGDLIVMQVGTEMMRGKVVDIDEGGLIASREGKEAATKVTVQFQVTLAFPPRTRGVKLLKLVDPAATEAALRIISGKAGKTN